MKAAITIDKWKLQTFQTVLSEAGFIVTLVNGELTPGVLILTVETDETERLRNTIMEAQRQCALIGHTGNNTRH